MPIIIFPMLSGPGDEWRVQSPTSGKNVRRWSFDEVNGWYYQIDNGKKTFF